MSLAYYNENDPAAAQWIRNLIASGHVAPGIVDERSIEDVPPNDLRGFTQCHFFAGIAVWSYALRLAGWPDSRPVWTGSCPCQPFSQAGKGGGVADERHLWPSWYHLIRHCKPQCVFGEQVASRDGLDWFATVRADLEGAGYAVGGGDICAAGAGAPHIRQRLYFVGVGDLLRPRLAIPQPSALESTGWGIKGGAVEQPSGAPCFSASSFWSDADWIDCTDGKARPVEPGTFPLAARSASHVVRLRGYGNAICAPLAAQWIRAFLDC